MPSMVEAVPLSWVLLVAGGLFCIGLFGSLSRRNTIGILFGVELMLNAVNLNLDCVLALPGAEPGGGPGVRAVYHHRGGRRGGGGPGDDHRDLSLAADGECG